MSRLRLTGGVARGRVLDGYVAAGVRPTSSRVREAWFSMVGHDLSGVSVLDAFAGSGVMTLEAWSRGADVTAFEKDTRAFRAIQQHLATLGASNVDLRRGDARTLLPTVAIHDVVFADPPYAHAPGDWLPLLVARASTAVWFEASSRTAMPSIVEGFTLTRSRTFGESVLHAYEPA